MALEAVLFDLDGTITDTEADWAAVMDELAAELGGSISPAAHAAMVGLPAEPSIAIIHAELGLGRDWQVTADELTRRLMQRYRVEIALRPGAAELLAAVRSAGLATALVTATERPLVEMMLETLGGNGFDVLVTGTDVTRSKPDPEPYLRALGALDVDADSAVAIEDSPHGTASAIAAGLRTLVVPSGVVVPAGPDRTFVSSLTDVGLSTLHDLLNG